MIPATQRTNNVPGYAIDVTPWSTENQIWIKMEGYTPLLPTNSVFEMYTTVKDKLKEDSYDTVKCSTEFWGLGIEGTIHDFKVEDYQSKTVFHDFAVEGNNQSSVAEYLDTANGGVSDWYISPFEGEATYDCSKSYCKVTCVVYRKLVTEDKENDVQYTR